MKRTTNSIKVMTTKLIAQQVHIFRYMPFALSVESGCKTFEISNSETIKLTVP
jgi:hypothetical protein